MHRKSNLPGIILKDETMKKYIVISALLFAATAMQSQVIINKDATQSLSSDSVLLEFGSENKGLLLPWVTDTASVAGAVPGTMVYDTSDKKVKFLKGTVWTDLSVDTTGVVDSALQDLITDAANAKTIIGDRTATAPGILVLESETNAMVLPKVASPHLNIINPSAGMMVYDTVKKHLVVFNGTTWSFWKPLPNS